MKRMCTKGDDCLPVDVRHICTELLDSISSQTNTPVVVHLTVTMNVEFRLFSWLLGKDVHTQEFILEGIAQ